MFAPRLRIDLDKVTHNARQLRALYGSKGVRITAVTKCVCGSLSVARALLRGGIRSLGDPRLANIQKMRTAGLDAQFVLSLAALDRLLWQLVSFEPRWLVVSAGFDTYIHDPVGSFQVTTDGFGQIGRRIRRLGLPTLVVQEGGYCVPDSGENVAALLSGLTGLHTKVRRRERDNYESEKETQTTPAQAKAAPSTSTA
jgi:hypothetical protein